MLEAVATRTAFAAYLKQGVLQANTAEMQKLSVTLYRLLGRGAPVTRAQLALACGFTQERVEQLMAEFMPTTVALGESGAVIAFGGLSIVPTAHRFVTEDAELYTWCVFDALFLPEILGKTAILVTHCLTSGVELTVALAPGELRAPSSSASVMSIVTPDYKACCDDLRKAFCDRVNLFRDEQAFKTWSQDRRDVGHVPLQEAQLFARQRNALRYPDVELSRSRT